MNEAGIKKKLETDVTTKIPITIGMERIADGCGGLVIEALVGDIRDSYNICARIFTDYNSLERDIRSAIGMLRINAINCLDLVRKGKAVSDENEDAAYRVVLDKRNPEQRFILIYPKSQKKAIEPRLGIYSALEKWAMDDWMMNLDYKEKSLSPVI